MKKILGSILFLLAIAIASGRAAAQQFDFGAALMNGTFEEGLGHWMTWASERKSYDGSELNYQESYFTPAFKMADDPRRFINNATLQIDGVEFTRWQGGVYQVVNVPPEAELWFTAAAAVFSTGQDAQGHIAVVAGIDPGGKDGCANAVWSEPVNIGHEQKGGRVASPRVKVGSEGRATVCLRGEPQYPLYKNALFVDDVTLNGRGGLTLPPAATPDGFSALSAPQSPPDPSLAGLIGTPTAPTASGASDPALTGLTGVQSPAETGGASGWLAGLAALGLVAIIFFTLRQRRAR